MHAGDQDKFLKEQIDYYQARAGEYDEWFFRQGRYDRGPELNQRWFNEIGIIRQALDLFKPEGEVLELACGTGIWTQYLLRFTDRITAVDAATEALAINQRRTQSSSVRYKQENLFSWQPDKEYDLVFFSFWLSHVPPERFEAFWNMVSRALTPEGRVFFIDSQYEPTSTARDHQLREEQSTVVNRRLNDGREFQIVKVFYYAPDLSQRLGKLGWSCAIKETESYFLYGSGVKTGN